VRIEAGRFRKQAAFFEEPKEVPYNAERFPSRAALVRGIAHYS
jgi:hypothetical protein